MKEALQTIVRKAGEIIPEVLSVVAHTGGGCYRFPEVCPSCGAPVSQEYCDKIGADC